MGNKVNTLETALFAVEELTISKTEECNADREHNQEHGHIFFSYICKIVHCELVFPEYWFLLQRSEASEERHSPQTTQTVVWWQLGAHHDNAPTHCALKTRKFFDRTKTIVALHSPDLGLSGFLLFPRRNSSWRVAVLKHSREDPTQITDSFWYASMKHTGPNVYSKTPYSILIHDSYCSFLLHTYEISLFQTETVSEFLHCTL